jgi:hypothetical protein
MAVVLKTTEPGRVQWFEHRDTAGAARLERRADGGRYE